jgi:prepilin-type N-terminal cleavage/methylation domain-containing protein
MAKNTKKEDQKFEMHFLKKDHRRVADAAAGSPQFSGAHAFTLIEVMMAVLLGAVMLTALWASFICGFATVKMTREDLRATQIMLKTMEAVRLYTYTQVTNVTFYPTIDYYDWHDQTNGDGGGTVYGISVTPVSPAPGVAASYRKDMCLVTIAVNWTNQLGSDPTNSVVHQRSMQTYVARSGLQDFVKGN